MYIYIYDCFFFFFSSRRRHTRLQGDWSSDVCSSDLFNTGSTLVQLSQKDCIKRLGWDDDMIEVLTGDLGVTGTDASVRDDWQRLLRAVGEDKVGLVAITATSRASRDRRDFAHLVALCRIYKVL